MKLLNVWWFQHVIVSVFFITIKMIQSWFGSSLNIYFLLTMPIKYYRELDLDLLYSQHNKCWPVVGTLVNMVKPFRQPFYWRTILLQSLRSIFWHLAVLLVCQCWRQPHKKWSKMSVMDPCLTCKHGFQIYLDLHK